MTSLIFGAVYLGHQAVVHARHEKKRIKNYERWEGLRDEYDEQRKLSRETRSLDIQRTGVPYDDDRPVLTLRDQQEANDARLGWRPQEAWNDPAQYQRTGRQSMDADALADHRSAITGGGQRTSSQPGMNRSASLANGYSAGDNSPLVPQQTGYHGVGPMRAMPTGATAWDDGLPRPLAVQRRTLEDDAPASPGLGRSISLRTANTRGSRSNLGSANSSTHNLGLSNSTTHTSPPAPRHASVVADKSQDDNPNNPFSSNSRFGSVSSPITQSFTQSPATTNNPFEYSQFGGSAQLSAAPPSNNPFEASTQTSISRPSPPRETSSMSGPQPFQFQKFGEPDQARGPPSQLPEAFGGPPAGSEQPSNNPFESGNRFDQQQQQQQQWRHPMPTMGMQPMPGTNAFMPSGSGRPMSTLQEVQTPAGEKDMSEWWKS